MTPGARISAAIEILDQVEADPRPADRVVEAYFRQRRYAGSKDRHAVAERAYGVLRRRRRIDWRLVMADWQAAPTGRTRVLADMALAGGQDRAAVSALCTGEGHAPAPLDEAEATLMHRLAGTPLEIGGMPLAVRVECPDALAGVLEAGLGADFEPVMRALLEEAPFDLRVNPLKAAEREKVRSSLAGGGMKIRPTALSPFGMRAPRRSAIDHLDLFKDGVIEVQDEGAQLAAIMVGAAPGMQVADFCAGAGGKTLVMAALMENKGRVLAMDTAAARLDRCQVRVKRAGLDNVEPRLLDDDSKKRLRRMKGRFDRVLVDAPCTGVGTWRRNPDARWRFGAEELGRLTVLQAEILERAGRLVKPGGRMIYVTCSLIAEENERQVEAFLAANADFKAMPVEQVWAETVGALGGPECPVTGSHLKLLPDRHGTDGFFIAVLRRDD
jgi:16S rRNA (cytosine967-C5)-methyltransferase